MSERVLLQRLGRCRAVISGGREAEKPTRETFSQRARRHRAGFPRKGECACHEVDGAIVVDHDVE
jgi:hypothetical protein